MHTFEVRIEWKGRTVTQQGSAGAASTVIEDARSRFPGGFVRGVRCVRARHDSGESVGRLQTPRWRRV
jgi:hypothetical protein